MAAIDFIPLEILQEIFAHVQYDSTGRKSLAHCALVCRSWSQQVIPLLYRHLVFNSRNIQNFYSDFNPDYSPFVRSLTINLRDVTATDPVHSQIKLYYEDGIAYREEHIAYRELSLVESRILMGLQKLSDIIPGFSSLTSFSFAAVVEGVSDVDFDLEKSVIPLLDSLPECCVCLELDLELRVRSRISIGMPSIPRHHIFCCDKLRLMLPRMEHVRLRVPTLCPALLGTGSMDVSKEYPETYEPISLPRLRTFVIVHYCLASTRFHWTSFRQCYEIGLLFQAIPSLAKAFEQLIANGGLQVPSAEIDICREIPAPSNNDLSVHETYIRTDIVSRTSIAFPHYDIGTTAVLLRDDKGQEYISDGLEYRNFLEGEKWVDTLGGSRLPSAIFDVESSRFGLRKRHLNIKTSAWWENHSLDVDCPLLENEKLTGMQLLEGEKRVGVPDCLSDEPVSQKTPSGYVRAKSDSWAYLYKLESSNRKVQATEY
ncbi:hypothetical protein FQN57_005071 [Myotisia sp. PD_48]|nr:hypothetical protein FQN57_005071 [Myotisia sp. PD_48]